jgi:hypothetical protein
LNNVTLETAQGEISLNYSVQVLPEQSDAQVAATIGLMNGYVCEDCISGPVVFDAQTALALNPDDPLAAVHSFVKQRMVFRRDEDITAGFDWMLPRNGEDNYFVECLKRPVDVSFRSIVVSRRLRRTPPRRIVFRTSLSLRTIAVSELRWIVRMELMRDGVRTRLQGFKNGRLLIGRTWVTLAWQ